MRYLLLFGILLLVAGCQPQTDSQPSPSPSESSGVPTSSPKPTAKPTERSSRTPTIEPTISRATPDPATEAKPVITFKQEGGFAGLDQTWSIFSDGRVLTPDGGMVLVEADSVSDLLVEIEQAGFFALSQPKTEPVCCDFFTFTISARYGDQENTISMSEGGPDLPPAFTTSVLAIQEFLPQAQEQ